MGARGVVIKRVPRKYVVVNFYAFSSGAAQDEVAEWLRRWTANPLGSARVGSNPILVGKVLWCNG